MAPSSPTRVDTEALLRQVDDATRTDPRAALRLVERALAARPDGKARSARLVRARLLRYRAHARRALNDFAGSLADYRRALSLFEKLDEEHEAAITRIGQVAALFYRGRHDDALEAARAARAVFVRRGDALRTARLDTNTGNIFHRLDRPGEALKWYDRARRTFRRLRDADGVALAEFNRGNVLVLLGRIDEARTAYESARDRFRERGHTLGVAEADYGLAYLLTVEHRLTDALEAFEELGPRLERLQERRLSALCEMDSAETYLRLNLWEESVDRAERAARTFRALDMRYEEARATTFAGVGLQRLGRSERALAAWRRATLLFRREGNRTWEGQIALFASKAERSRGRRGPAQRRALEARRLLAPPAPPGLAAEADWLLGVLALESAAGAPGRRRARRLLTGAGRVARRLGDAALLRDVEESLGELARGEGRPAVARRHLLAAVEAGEHLRGLISGDEFHAAFFRDRSHPYLSLARLALDGGRVGEAYEWIERGRARALLENIDRRPRAARSNRGGGPGRRRTAPPSGAPRDREELEAILRRLAADYQPIATAQAGRRPSGATGRLPESLRTHLEGRADRLLTRLYPALRGGGSAISRRDDTTTPASNEALLSYFESDGALHAFVETADGLSLTTDLAAVTDVARLVERLEWQWGRFRLGAERFERHARLLRNDIVEDLRLLHDLLVAPLVQAGSRDTWIVVPTRTLAPVPFAALHDGRGFLVESRRLAVVPGRAVLNMCRARTRRSGSGTLLVGLPGPGTPEVAPEMTAVARHARRPLTTLRGADATVAAFLDAAPGRRVVHLATHGFFHQDRPRLSGVRLADRWLHAADVERLDLAADLVVLSACQSGTSLVMGGDEWMGLPRAFLKAGAARVLAGLWDVDDRATRRLMSRFSAEFARPGATAAGALARAQRALLRKESHPYFWAGFQLLGAP
jgi:CHAT domain-containing protein/tetratricopeptide (TPR) repeat protein